MYDWTHLNMVVIYICPYTKAQIISMDFRISSMARVRIKSCLK